MEALFWCRVSPWATVTAPQANEKMLRNTVAVYLTPKLAPAPAAGTGSAPSSDPVEAEGGASHAPQARKDKISRQNAQLPQPAAQTQQVQQQINQQN